MKIKNLSKKIWWNAIGSAIAIAALLVGGVTPLSVLGLLHSIVCMIEAVRENRE